MSGGVTSPLLRKGLNINQSINHITHINQTTNKSIIFYYLYMNTQSINVCLMCPTTIGIGVVCVDICLIYRICPTTTGIGVVCVAESFLGSYGAGRVFVKPDV